MAGIYIHIPFCKQACSYCNFHFSTLTVHRNEMIKAILAEIEMRAYFFSDNTQLQSIYFGGGTPSILPVEAIQTILEKIYATFTITENPEITLEANPDDLSRAYLEQLKSETKINRLSIGVQSFFEEDLHYMHRAHHALQAETAIKNALDFGFTNLTVDLIYGVPTLSDEHWKKNIQLLLDFGIPHISAYALTVEDKTMLKRHIQQHKKIAPEDDKAIRQYKLLIEQLEHAGFMHYEISNFAKPSFLAVHNSSYWDNAPYLGVGPSAHSYDGKNRFWNIANNAQFMKAIAAGNLLFEKEELSEQDFFNEYMMTKLRTHAGVSTIGLQDRFGNRMTTHFLETIQPYVQRNLVQVAQHNYRLTTEGKLLSDKIISDLFLV